MERSRVGLRHFPFPLATNSRPEAALMARLQQFKMLVESQTSRAGLHTPRTRGAVLCGLSEVCVALEVELGTPQANIELYRRKSL